MKKKELVILTCSVLIITTTSTYAAVTPRGESLGDIEGARPSATKQSDKQAVPNNASQGKDAFGRAYINAGVKYSGHLWKISQDKQGFYFTVDKELPNKKLNGEPIEIWQGVAVSILLSKGEIKWEGGWSEEARDKISALRKKIIKHNATRYEEHTDGGKKSSAGFVIAIPKGLLSAAENDASNSNAKGLPAATDLDGDTFPDIPDLKNPLSKPTSSPVDFR